MPEYSSTTITPADGVKTPAMNGSTSGNYTLADLRAFILASKGLANGLASLDANGKLPTSQLPDLADDVLVYGSYALLPSPGIAGKLYITADDNKMYRWDDALTTPDYVVLSVDLSDYATKAEVEAADTDLKNALEDSEQRIENLEQAVSGSLVTTNTDATQKNTKSITSANTILPWALLNRVGARAVSWNQLFRSDTPQVITPSTYNIFRWGSIIPNHVYLVITQIGICSWQLWESETNTYDWAVSGNNRNLGYFDSTVSAYIIKPTTYKYFCLRNQLNSSVLTENKNWQPMLFDLTVMSEYESNKTNQQNIDSFKAKYPASYYPYNNGGIIDTNPSAFEVRDASNNLVQTIDTSFTSDYKYVNENCHDYSENVLVDGQKKRKEHIVVDKVVYDGSLDENWGNVVSVGTAGNYRADISLANGQPNDVAVLCDKILGLSYNDRDWNKVSVFASLSDQKLFIVANTFTDVTTLKSWLSSNNITVYYKKASEVVNTYFDTIPNFPCEDGTTFTAITPQTDLVNAIDVPTTIAYMTKIGD